MDLNAIESCRACLIKDKISTMYDLALQENMNLFLDCSNSNITVRFLHTIYFPLNSFIQLYINRVSPPQQIPDELLANLPKYLCEMCYRLCGVVQSFKRRCQETDQTLTTRISDLQEAEREVAESVAVPAVVKSEPVELIEKQEQDPLLTNEDSSADSEQQKCNWDKTSTPDPPYSSASSASLSVRPLQSLKQTAKRPLQSLRQTAKRPLLQVAKRPRKDAIKTLIDSADEFHLWTYFLRETQNFSKCLWPNCKGVIRTGGNSTVRLRAHLLTMHSLKIVPPKR